MNRYVWREMKMKWRGPEGTFQSDENVLDLNQCFSYTEAYIYEKFNYSKLYT